MSEPNRSYKTSDRIAVSIYRLFVMRETEELHCVVKGLCAVLRGPPTESGRGDLKLRSNVAVACACHAKAEGPLRVIEVASASWRDRHNFSHTLKRSW